MTLIGQCFCLYCRLYKSMLNTTSTFGIKHRHINSQARIQVRKSTTCLLFSLRLFEPFTLQTHIFLVSVCESKSCSFQHLRSLVSMYCVPVHTFSVCQLQLWQLSFDIFFSSFFNTQFFPFLLSSWFFWFRYDFLSLKRTRLKNVQFSACSSLDELSSFIYSMGLCDKRTKVKNRIFRRMLNGNRFTYLDLNRTGTCTDINEQKIIVKF